nr:hypothetical protein BaRGS_009571 [Batillaria attramentaria]
MLQPKGKDDDLKKQDGEKVGSGRAIPVKQGYLYKKSHGLNKEWKKKYVSLTDDGRLTYHPSLHPPAIEVATMRMRVAKGNHRNDFLSYALSSAREGKAYSNKDTPNVKKRHRRAKSGGVKNVDAGAGDESDGYEFMIVSLDNKNWHSKPKMESMEVTKVMTAIGNAIANSVWEAKHKGEAKTHIFLKPDIRNIIIILGHATADDINAPYSKDDGRTALHIAAALGNVVYLQLLLWYCANVKVVDHEGRNALWYARTSGSSECTELLTAAGCPDHATLPRRRGSLQPGKNDVFDKLPASVI